VNARIGLSKTVIILTADHGVLPLVEVLRSRNLPARRVKPEELESLVLDALKKKFPGKDGLIASNDGPNYWLDKEKIQSQGLNVVEVEDEIIRALKASGIIEVAYKQEDFFKTPPEGDPYFPLFQNSFFASRSPDILATVKKYLYMDHYIGGTGHGTPYDYDRHIPIIFQGPGVKAGLYESLCGPEDIAPTLASMLGLEYPKEADSRILSEMFPAK
jgi:arylsulfatase A-like enzyme